MKTSDFMNANLNAIKKLIKEQMSDKFDSHIFIRALAKKYEYQYVLLLRNYRKDAHRNVHAQIARHLSKNKDYFEIEKHGKVRSATVFGFNNSNELWSKK
ncbi:hypothetical protein [Flavobacterium sp. UBA7682]|uniref:hypothetical protein n=1 Tax=Flavobacterium sp. UBA7682 TaxID=1946560 RepID=UPI0025C1856D|nr:hypothetical protein [Flavobacterium sp. UBA7682]